MYSEGSVSSKWVKLVLNVLASNGLDCQLLCDDLGLDFAALQAQKTRIDQDQLSAIWNAAAAMSGRDDIGMVMGSKESVLGIEEVVYAFMVSESLLEGYKKIADYVHLVAHSAKIELRLEPEGYWIDLSLRGGRNFISGHSYEALIAWLVSIAKWVSPGDLMPRKVEFSHNNALNAAHYSELFSAPVNFASDKNSICFSVEDFERPLPTANKHLAIFHEKILDETSPYKGRSKFIRKVKQEVKFRIASKNLNINVIAAVFNLSPRTFQRRLGDEGISFRSIVDGIRRDLARDYVCEDDYTLEKAAYKIGYSEPPAFLRGFKRWYGCTPGQYRKQFYLSIPEGLRNDICTV